MSTHWDPSQYLRFSDQRLRPALDLLAQIRHTTPARVVDLGCGGGNVTKLLKARWPTASVIGIDSSQEMIATAQAGVESAISWQRADIADWLPAESVDVIFSNAALHWLPEHRQLFPRLLGFLSPGGELAIQMPLSWHAPSHRILRDVLATGGPDGRPFGPESLRTELAVPNVGMPDVYYEMLASSSGELNIWQTEYLHVLAGEHAVLEWVKGTTLRPVFEALANGDRARFLEVYSERLDTAYPRRAGGETLYPFPRLFLIARRS